jgi:hypothetical protein
MAWVDGKAFRLFLPACAEVLIRGKAWERFEALRAMIGPQAGMPVLCPVVMGLVVLRLHGGLFAWAVHPVHLASGPGLVRVGQPMIPTMLMTDASQARLQGLAIALPIGALEAMIRAHRVDLVGSGGHHVPSELRGDQLVGFFMPLGIGTRTGAVTGDTQGAHAFCRADRGDIEMAGADRIGLQRLLPRLLAGPVRSTVDAMPRADSAAVPSGSGEAVSRAVHPGSHPVVAACVDDRSR